VVAAMSDDKKEESFAMGLVKGVAIFCFAIIMFVVFNELLIMCDELKKY
jgi:hypothetical protein